MGIEFDSEIIKMKPGQNLMELFRGALEGKGLDDRIDNDNGLFFVDNVTVKSINGDEVMLEVEYEYGG